MMTSAAGGLGLPSTDATAAVPSPRPPSPSSSSSLISSLSITFEDLVVSTSPAPTLIERAKRAIGGGASNASSSSSVHHILKRCSGYIPPNALTAVMGGSGAGKTTLLNFLAHRLSGCGAIHRRQQQQQNVGTGSDASSSSNNADRGGYHVSGSLRVNGHTVSTKFFSQVCAYVPQQSILLSALTPRESIQFASKLRLPVETKEEEHEKNTERVLMALSLHSCANTRIGDELTGGGISGGEKRRTNIGVELVTSPPLLCLDEPTTGLDSLTALNVLKSLKQLTTPQKEQQQPSSEKSVGSDSSSDNSSKHNGVTIICSIHQPSSEMYDLFDHLILLSHGRIVYCGSTRDAISYFSNLGHACPPLENPPEYFLDLILLNPALVEEVLEGEYRKEYERKYKGIHESRSKHKKQGVISIPKHGRTKSMINEIKSPEGQCDPTTTTVVLSSPQSQHAAMLDTVMLFSSPEPIYTRPIGAEMHQRKMSSLSSGNGGGVELVKVGGRAGTATTSKMTVQQQQHNNLNASEKNQQQLDELEEDMIQATKTEEDLFISSPATRGRSVGVSTTKKAASPSSFFTSLYTSLIQLKYLIQRTHLNSSRLPLLKGAQILQTIVLGLLIGVAFWNLGKNQLAVQNRLGAVYFINICVIFANTLSVVLTFSEERSLFLREQGNRMYSVWSYFLARLSVEILPTAACSFGLALICFWMIDSSGTFSQFLKFTFIILLLAYVGQGIGLIVSCGISSRMLAMIITPLAIAPFILFTPYAISEESIPKYFIPFQVGSPFWWGFTGLMLNMFDGLSFYCLPDETIAIPLRDGSFYLLCPYPTGLSVLERFNISTQTSTGEDQFWLCCGVLIVLCFVYRVIALIMLYALAWRVKDATK